MTISRTELLLILLITVLGAALRCVRLDELAVEHFDEGVYASNLLFTAEEGFQYPQRFLYAPPLLPALVEWSQILTGGASWAPFLPGLLLGSLTVPLVWLFVRRCYSPAGGLAAASFVALNDYHIALSRSVLTDAPLGFCLVLAVWLIIEALVSGRLRWAIAGGLASGLAWTTKYNGWLPLAILTSGGIAAVVCARWFVTQSPAKNRDGSRKSKARAKSAQDAAASSAVPDWSGLVKVVLSVGVVAIAVWSPVWFDLQQVGGYARVAENHRQYVTGFAGWWDAAVLHARTQQHGAGLTTLLGGWLAVISITLLSHFDRSTWNETERETGAARSTWNESESNPAVERSTWNSRMPWQATLIVGTIAGAVAFTPLVMFVLWSCYTFGRGLTRLVRLSKSGSWPLTDDERRRLWVSHWLGLAWLCGLLLATPLYRAYPRLLMPLLCVGWVGTGVAIARLMGMYRRMYLQSADAQWVKARHVGQIPRGIVVTITILLSIAVMAGRAGSAWQVRTDLVAAADRCVASAREHCQGESSSVPDLDCIIYVYGEPALFYHLSRDRVLARPVAKLDVAHDGIPTFVAAGPHADRSPQFARQLAEAGDSLTLVAQIAYRLSDFVLLDEYPPRELDEHRVEEIRLYRVR